MKHHEHHSHRNHKRKPRSRGGTRPRDERRQVIQCLEIDKSEEPYEDLKGALSRMCDDAVESRTLSVGEIHNVVWISAHIKINM